MIFLFWLLFTSLQSHGLIIPPSPTSTKTTGTTELVCLVKTPEVEGDAQTVLGQRKLVICGCVGGDAGGWLNSLSADFDD